jgi:hypothetical protein
MQGALGPSFCSPVQLLATLIAVLGIQGAAADEGAQRPNVAIFLADDQVMDVRYVMLTRVEK